MLVAARLSEANEVRVAHHANHEVGRRHDVAVVPVAKR